MTEPHSVLPAAFTQPPLPPDALSELSGPTAGPVLPLEQLTLTRVSLQRGGKPVLKHLDLSLQPGELVALMGPSGVGKSSLLQVISGELLPDTGEVSLNGQPLLDLPETPRTRLRASYFGMLGQEFGLLPRLAGLQNVALPLLLQNKRPADALAQARLALQWFGLETLADRPAGQLSRGQQQRLALARALVTRAPVLLLDEPDASLDEVARNQMLQHLRSVAAQGTAILFTTHDPAAAAYASRCLTLRAGKLEPLALSQLDESLAPARAAASAPTPARAPASTTAPESASARGLSVPATGFWSRLRLMGWSVTGYKAALLRSTLGVWLGVSLTVLGMSLSLSLEAGLSPLLMGDGARLKVQPARLTIGPLDLMGTLLKPRALTPERLLALEKVPGVAQVWPELWSRFPVGLRGSLLGHGLYSDGALLGLPPEAVARELSRPFRWTPPSPLAGTTAATGSQPSALTGRRSINADHPIPVLVPRLLFAVYNGSFAPANGFPRLNERSVVGLTFQIVAGRSSFASVSETSTPPGAGVAAVHPLVLDAEIVGLTSYGDALAAVVPLEAVQWLEQQLAMPDAGGYSSAMLQVRPGADPQQVQAQVQGQGWSVEEVSGAIRQLALALSLLKGAVLAIGVALIGVALLLMGQVYRLLLEQRAPELQSLWLAGLPRAELRRGLGLEGISLTGLVCALASLGGAAGVALALPGLQVWSEQTSGLTLTLPFVPPSGFLVGLWLLAPGFTLLTMRPVLKRIGQASSEP